MWITGKVSDLVLRDVGDVEGRLERQEIYITEHSKLIISQINRAGRFSLVQGSFKFAENFYLHFSLFTAALQEFFNFCDSLVDYFQVRKTKLSIDSVDVTQRINSVGDVGDIAVLKAADNVSNGVNLPNMLKEFIAETLTL